MFCIIISIIDITACAAPVNLYVRVTNEDKLLDKLVAVSVEDVLNIRSEPDINAEKVGQMYDGCGGIILDRTDGWIKLQSGNLTGWANDDYLLFGNTAYAYISDSYDKIEPAAIMAVLTDTINVRTRADTDADIMEHIDKGSVVTVLDYDDEWMCIKFDGHKGYMTSEYAILYPQMNIGETMKEIKKVKQPDMTIEYVSYDPYMANADIRLLLASLIYCEAGNQSFEGMVAVGAVVMNRVRSGSFPNDIYDVIYQQGQFTPVTRGKVDRVYWSGNIPEICIQAADEALSGVSPVGDCLYFRRCDGSDGLILGDHVFR